jgi:hypothetical protein
VEISPYSNKNSFSQSKLAPKYGKGQRKHFGTSIYRYTFTKISKWDREGIIEEIASLKSHQHPDKLQNKSNSNLVVDTKMLSTVTQMQQEYKRSV